VHYFSYAHAQPSSSPSIATDVSALAFTGGSRYLATGGADRLVHVWDLKKRENIRNLTVRVCACVRRSDNVFV
jgi:WD40 repeat protein